MAHAGPTPCAIITHVATPHLMACTRLGQCHADDLKIVHAVKQGDTFSVAIED